MITHHRGIVGEMNRGFIPWFYFPGFVSSKKNKNLQLKKVVVSQHLDLIWENTSILPYTELLICKVSFHSPDIIHIADKMLIIIFSIRCFLWHLVLNL